MLKYINWILPRWKHCAKYSIASRPHFGTVSYVTRTTRDLLWSQHLWETLYKFLPHFENYLAKVMLTVRHCTISTTFSIMTRVTVATFLEKTSHTSIWQKKHIVSQQNFHFTACVPTFKSAAGFLSLTATDKSISLSSQICKINETHCK